MRTISKTITYAACHGREARAKRVVTAPARVQANWQAGDREESPDGMARETRDAVAALTAGMIPEIRHID